MTIYLKNGNITLIKSLVSKSSLSVYNLPEKLKKQYDISIRKCKCSLNLIVNPDILRFYTIHSSLYNVDIKGNFNWHCIYK